MPSVLNPTRNLANNYHDSAMYHLACETDRPHLTYFGLRETDREGVEMIVDWARTHDAWDGSPLPDNLQGRILPSATEIASAMMQNQETRGRFAQGAEPLFAAAFGVKSDQELYAAPLPSSVLVGPPSQRLDLPKVKLMHDDDARRKALYAQLPDMLQEELKAVRGSAPEHKLAVFKAYTDTLWAFGQNEHTEVVSQNLLDTLELHADPKLRALARKDFNGAGWGVAQSMALGIDPNRLERSFPKAVPSAQINGVDFLPTYVIPMSKVMAYVDDYRRAMGLEIAAAAYMKKPLLSRIFNDRTILQGKPLQGNKYWGGFKPCDIQEEQRPFATTGLNWGILMFPGDKEVKSLPVQAGFEFPIDYLSDDSFISIFPENGDRLKIFNASGQELSLEKVIHQDESGQAIAWSARFRDAQGQEVPPQSVLGRVWAEKVQCLQGDGRADKTKDTTWWGHCERNAAQAVYKVKYEIPQIDREIVPIRAGDKIVHVPREEAQKIFDTGIFDLVPRWSYCGFAFRDSQCIVTLKDGRQLKGQIEGLKHVPNTPSSVRIRRDRIRVPNTADSFVGESLEFRRTDGQKMRIPGADVLHIEGATEDDLRISHYLGWIAEQKGVYISDSAIGEPVSNGPRWVNKVEIEAREDDQRPVWGHQGGERLYGIQGEVIRVPGDKILWIKGMYADRGDIEQSESGEVDAEKMHIQFSGWAQVNQNGRIVNEGFLYGQPDFAWNADGPLDWTKPSAYCPFVTPEYRLQLLVNGIKDRSKVEALAERLNLPENWRDYRVDADPSESSSAQASQ